MNLNKYWQELEEKRELEKELLENMYHLFDNQITGQPITLKHNRGIAIYEIDNQDFCFTVSTRHRNRPQRLQVPSDLDSLAKKVDSIYIDDKKKKVVTRIIREQININSY